MITNVFRDIAIKMAKKQQELVDALTEEAPILQMIPMQPASHGFQNVYEKLVSIKGAKLADLDDELPEVDVTSKLEQEDLSVIGGTMYVGDDKARKFGGPSSYFNGKLPSILRQTGSDTEKSLIYDVIRQTAIDNGNVIDIGGSADTNFSILVVKWVRGENIGLYDPTGPGRNQGKLLETIPLVGGQRFKKKFDFADGSSKEITVFGADFKTYFGLQLANPRYVSAMVNIDIDTDPRSFPTEKQINELLHRARATAGNTFIYMHPRLMTELLEYKSAHLQVEVNTSDMNFRFNAWNGIPIITSYNFEDGLETNV